MLWSWPALLLISEDDSEASSFGSLFLQENLSIFLCPALFGVILNRHHHVAFSATVCPLTLEGFVMDGIELCMIWVEEDGLHVFISVLAPPVQE